MFKYTKNLLTGKHGLLIDKKRVLENKYIKIIEDYKKCSNPIYIGQTPQNYFDVYDIKTNQIINRDNCTFFIFDNINLNREKPDAKLGLRACLVNLENRTSLYVGGKEYSTNNYSRIETLLSKNYYPIFLLKEKQNSKVKILNTGSSFLEGTEIIRKVKDNPNPYMFLLMNCRISTPFKDYEVNEKNVKNTINTYFKNLLDSALPEEKQSIVNEKIECIKTIIEYFESLLEENLHHKERHSKTLQDLEKAKELLSQIPQSVLDGNLKKELMIIKNKIQTEKELVESFENFPKTYEKLKQSFDNSMNAYQDQNKGENQTLKTNQFTF